jgi:excisionase family DNA binding protein
MDKLLAKKEIAEVLGVTVKTIDKWVSEKRIPFVRITGKCVRFIPEDVRAYFQGQTIQPDPPQRKKKPARRKPVEPPKPPFKRAEW